MSVHVLSDLQVAQLKISRVVNVIDALTKANIPPNDILLVALAMLKGGN